MIYDLLETRIFTSPPPDIFIKPFLLIGAYNGPYIQDSVGGEVIFCLLTQACQCIRWYQEQNNKRKNKKTKPRTATKNLTPEPNRL